MKKKITSYAAGKKHRVVEEPVVPMVFAKRGRIIPSLKEFTYSEFKKISEKVPFSHAEWASILHVSERTLQRYAKNNGAFAPINAERALQIAELIKRGMEVLGDANTFYHWLKRNPYMLEGNLSFESLATQDGINKVLAQLGRIEHGIFA